MKETADAIFYNREKAPPRFGWRYGQKKPPDDIRDVLFYNDNEKNQRIMPIQAD